MGLLQKMALIEHPRSSNAVALDMFTGDANDHDPKNEDLYVKRSAKSSALKYRLKGSTIFP
jgi:hypothetical protein